MVKVVISSPPAATETLPPADAPLLAKVIAALKQVFDPELPVNVYDLGLVYRLQAHTDGRVDVDMTLTAPNCPVADHIVESVKQAVIAVPGVTAAHIKLVWEPKWHKGMMNEAARLELGLFG